MAKKRSRKKAALPDSPRCGLVMPISACDGCSELHWLDVKRILTDAVEGIGFTANLVSDADDVGVIHERIIHNLYENPIVVCDVSGRNANVMFELGMRLAFDKPTIIVKDEKTAIPFDAGQIEHLEYPRDLRHARIEEFKENLGKKVAATHKRASTDPSYTTFLKHFGQFKVSQLESKEVSKEDFIIKELKDLQRAVSRLTEPPVGDLASTFSPRPKREGSPQREESLRTAVIARFNRRNIREDITDAELTQLEHDIYRELRSTIGGYGGFSTREIQQMVHKVAKERFRSHPTIP